MKSCWICLLLLFTASAQDSQLTEVSGEVYDMLGKPIANAVVVYTDVEHGGSRHLLTDLNGRYRAIGLPSGTYDIQITSPTGEPIYSGKKHIYAEAQKNLNVISVDLSVVPTTSSLVPFKGPTAAEIQGAPWRKVNQEQIKDLTPQQVAELRAENAAIARYMELVPEARAAIRSQDWPRAAEHLHSLIAVAPYQWQLYQNLGTVLRSLHRNVEAIQVLEKGIQVARYDDGLVKDQKKFNSTLSQMIMLEGEAYDASAQPAAAATQYRKAIEINPKFALAYMMLCIAEYHNRNDDAAIGACTQGIAADPTQPEYYQILAGMESNFERYEDAIPIYEKGIRLAERKREASQVSVSLPARLDRGMADMMSAEQVLLSEGDAAYKARAGQMLLAEGNAYFQLKSYQQAAGLFVRAARWHNYPALAYFNLCATQFDVRKWKAAVEACDQAISSDAKMADAYYVKASALAGQAAEQGKVQSSQAVVALHRYLELAPDGAYAGDARALLRELSRGN